MDVSATKVSTYVDCARKFLFDFVMELKAPPGPSAVLGTKTHGHAEKFLKESVPPPTDTLEGRMAQALLEHIPPRPPGTYLVEEAFKLETFPGGPKWNGRIDLLDLGYPLVYDFKTSKDFYYAKMAPELLVDPQMVSYSVLAKLWVPNAPRVYAKHIYVSSKPKGPVVPTMVVPVVFELDQLSREWEKNVARVREMHAIAEAKPDPNDVRPNPLMCRRYGGCPHQARCGLSPGKALGGVMSTLDDLRRNHQASQMQPILPPEVLHPGHYVPAGFVVAPPEVQSHYQMPVMLRKEDGQVTAMPALQPQNPAPPPPTPPPPPPVQAAPPPPTPPVQAPVALAGKPVILASSPVPAAYQASWAAPVTPPPGVTSPPPAPPVVPVIASATFNTVEQGAASLDAANGTTPATGAASIQPIATAGAPKKSGPGRPRKSAAAAAAATPTATEPEDFELWVDCLPTKGAPNITAVEDWVRGALEIATKLAGADWRCVDYNKGKGYLYAALAQHVVAVGPPTGVVVMRASMTGADVIEEFLTPYTTRVIRGAGGGR